MKNRFTLPKWVPQVEPDSKVLIVGASGGIGQEVIHLMLKGPACVIGTHRSTSKPFSYSPEEIHTIFDLQYTLKTDKDCKNLVDSFVKLAKGIDCLVTLCGGILQTDHWEFLTEQEWKNDINLNLNIPFFLARAAMKHMEGKGGRIILTGTESALHGGSPTSFAYGVAKRGIECLVQGLARDGAKFNILINGIRPGFIRSGFHERWQYKRDEDLTKRAKCVPLKRAGKPEEVAALIIYLLSGWSEFITGQMFAITGGDWL